MTCADGRLAASVGSPAAMHAGSRRWFVGHGTETAPWPTGVGDVDVRR